MDRMDDFIARYPTAEAGSAPGTAIDMANPTFPGYILNNSTLTRKQQRSNILALAAHVS